MARVPPVEGQATGSSSGNNQSSNSKYGTSHEQGTVIQRARRRLQLVAAGLITFALLATAYQLFPVRQELNDGLAETSELWDMSRAISDDEIKRAIKSELAPRFRAEMKSLETSLNIRTKEPKVWSSSSEDYMPIRFYPFLVLHFCITNLAMLCFAQIRIF